jgi:RNA polymerase sigma-70 factor (ECF subfamily)
MQVTGNADDAQDALQESFIKACGQMELFEGRSELGTWLYRIVLNTSLMHLRKRRPDAVSLSRRVAEDAGNAGENRVNPVEQIADRNSDPADQLVAVELKEKLDRAILLLPDSLRATFVLRDIEGLSTKEAAEALDIGEAALKVRLHRARLLLREALAPYISDRAAPLEDRSPQGGGEKRSER